MAPSAPKKKTRPSTAEAKKRNAELQYVGVHAAVRLISVRRDFRKRRDTYKNELEDAVGTLRDTVAQLVRSFRSMSI